MTQAATSIPAVAQIPDAARRTGLVERSIFCLFVAGLAWVPFWHGSNEAITWGVNAVLFPGLAVLYEAGLGCGVNRIRSAFGMCCSRRRFSCCSSCGSHCRAQRGCLADAVNPVWEMAGDAVGMSLAASISVNRDLTAAALLRLITGASVFWLALQLCRDAARARALVAAIALIGAVYAGYGLIAAKTGWLRMLDLPQSGAVSATFINPDSYAAYAGIGFIATVGVFLRLCRRYGIGGSDTPRQQMAALVEMIGHYGAPVLAGGFTILSALLLTGSRGGIVATGLATIVFVALARHGRAGREPKSWRLLILGLVAVGGTGLLFSTALVDKITRAGLFDPNRFAMYRLTLRSIIDRPWLGWGYGTFVDVFPMYRDGSIGGSGTWSQAHNTYLEAVQGLGIVFGSIFTALIALVLFRCFKGAAARRENATLPRLAVAVGVLVGTHALIDFSLQIQAVALTVAALLGAGLAQAESSQVCLDDGIAGPVHRGNGHRGNGHRAEGRGAHAQAPWTGAGWQARSSVLAVSIFCGYAALRGWQLAASAALDPDVDRTPPALATETIPGTAGATTTRRWLGLPGLGRSSFDLPLAQAASLDPETGRQLAAELTALLAVRPLLSQAWLSLAVLRLVAREDPTSVLAALRLSWLSGPHEGGVLWQRGVFGVALWDFLPADAREWTTRDLARAMRENLVADRQIAAIAPVLGARSAEARAQIGALLEKQGLLPADLARIGLPTM